MDISEHIPNFEDAVNKFRDSLVLKEERQAFDALKESRSTRKTNTLVSVFSGEVHTLCHEYS